MIHFRFARLADVDLYFEWANDELTRMNSYNREPVAYPAHVEWFENKLASGKCFFYLFLNEQEIPIGQVRIDNSGKECIIGISVDKKFRGKSLGVEMLKQSTYDFLQKYPQETIIAYIKESNPSSYRIFKKAGFSGEEKTVVKEVESCKLFLKK